MKNLVFVGGLIVVSLFFVRQFLEQSKKKVKNIPENPTRIVAFGDDYTLGKGVGSHEGYPSVLQDLLGKTVENMGVKDETTASALHRLESVFASNKPDIVVLTLGVADINSRLPLEKTLENLEKIFLYLLERNVMVVYGGISPPKVGDNWLMAISQLCGTLGVLYIGDIMHDFWDNKTLMTDALFPNAEGYRLIANKLEEGMRDYF